MILTVTVAKAFCPVQTKFATPINRFLTIALNEVVLSSKTSFRLYHANRMSYSIQFSQQDELQGNIQSARFTENCTKF